MDTTEIGFLRRDGDGFFPLDMGISKWSPDMINGPAITGILARAIENEHGAEGFVPARLTVDLFRPARAEQLHVVARSVRDGNRIRVADAEVIQQGEAVAAPRWCSCAARSSRRASSGLAPTHRNRRR